MANLDRAYKKDTSRNWECVAQWRHTVYGYLSHDYAVLGQVIETTGARFVLDFGGGSGRLVPVYLMHNVQAIWLQDVSGRALDFCRQRFFCQRQIRYFHGNVKSIPISTTVDLVVASRVLQHILDDTEFGETLNYLAPMTRYFYINEAGSETWRRDPYIIGRDYIRIFDVLGWRVTAQGELTCQDGTPQRWMLFKRKEEAAEQRAYNSFMSNRE